MGTIMTKERVHSRYTKAAIQLLGKLIKLRRRQACMTEAELAERVGISRTTLKKIEKGNPGVALGIAFEVATVLKIPLMGSNSKTINFDLDHIEAKLAVLPKRIHKKTEDVDDNF